MRSTLAALLLSASACFSPIPQADPDLLPIVKGTADAGSTPRDAGVDAGTSSLTIIVPVEPERRIVEALAPNPPFAFVNGDGDPIDGGCRGDDYLRGVPAPRCEGNSCVVRIDRDRTTHVLGAGQSILATGERRIAWSRSVGQAMRVVVADVSGQVHHELPLGTSSSTMRQYTFDGDDLIVLESNTSTRVIRSGDTRTVELGSAEGRLAYVEPKTDSTGRVWFVTASGLFRTQPRDAAAGPIERVPTPGPLNGLRSFALVDGGTHALVAIDAAVWLVDGTTAGLQQLAQFPEDEFISAIAPWTSGFAAIVRDEVYVFDGRGPITKLLAHAESFGYFSVEAGLEVRGRTLLVSAACLSWSSYPGYDVAVIDPDRRTADWWWNQFPSQWDIARFPVGRANVAGSEWRAVPLDFANGSFVTVLPTEK